MATSQHDIARILGISRSTVSRALADSPLVSNEMKRRVRATCDEYGYEPDYIATSMSTKATRMISVVVGSHLSALHLQWVQLLRRRVIESNYLFRWDDAEGIGTEIAGRSADGFIGFGSCLDSHIHPAGKFPSLAYVMTDCPSYDWAGRPTVNSVSSDNLGGAAKAVEYLLSLGHERIAFFGLQPNGVCGERHQGYVKAMNNAGFPSPDWLTIHQPTWSDDYDAYVGYAQTMRHLVDEGVTAVLSTSDVGAVALIRLFRTMGISVPEDVSVIGFDDTVLTRMHQPRITVVRQDLELAAETAVVMLLRRIANREPAEGKVIPTQLIVAQTTGRSAKAGGE